MNGRVSKAGRAFLGFGLVAMLAACASTPAVRPTETVESLKADEAPPPPPETPLAERVASARSLVVAGDFAQAREKLQKALEKAPEDPDVRFLSGYVADREGRLEEAVEHYERAVEANPVLESALLNLGRLYRLRGSYDKAISIYTRALEQDPENVKVRNNLGVIYRLARKWDEAEKTLRRVLARAPGNVDAYKNMAALFYDMDKLDLAQQFLVEARKLKKDDAGIHNNLGLVYFKKDGEKRPTRALAAFREAARLDPNLAAAHANVGAIALAYRDYAKAEESYRAAVTLEPNDWETRLALGWTLEGARKCDRALPEYDKVLSLRPDYPDAVFGQGACHKQLRNWEGVLASFTRYVSLPGANRLEAAQAEIKSAEYMVSLNKKAPEPEVKKAPPAPPPAQPVPVSPEPGAPAPDGASQPEGAAPETAVVPGKVADSAPAEPVLEAAPGTSAAAEASAASATVEGAN